MSDPSIADGIVIGAAGGAIAGVTVSLAHWLHSLVIRSRHMRRVHDWLEANVQDEDGKRHRSTRAIASYNNLTEDRVRYICSHHTKIYFSTGPEEDMWGLYGIGREKPKK